MRPLKILVLAAFASDALAADPNQYDPLLDPPPDGGPAPARFDIPTLGVPGLRVASALGLYLGDVESYLTADLSRLQGGVHPSVSFGLGRRLENPVEFGIDFALGLGQAHQPYDDGTTDTIDVFVEPRLFAHFYETSSWSTYGGVGGLLGMFDLSAGGVGQLGFGPLGLLGVEFRSERFSALYIEFSGCFFYDFYAYQPETVAIGEGAAAMLVTQQESGEWFEMFRLSIGYRLAGF